MTKETLKELAQLDALMHEYFARWRPADNLTTLERLGLEITTRGMQTIGHIIDTEKEDVDFHTMLWDIYSRLAKKLNLEDSMVGCNMLRNEFIEIEREYKDKANETNSN